MCGGWCRWKWPIIGNIKQIRYAEQWETVGKGRGVVPQEDGEARLKLCVLSSVGRRQKSRGASEDRQQETISSLSLPRSSQARRQVPLLSTGPRKEMERAGGAGEKATLRRCSSDSKGPCPSPSPSRAPLARLLPPSPFPHFRNSSETHLAEGLPGSRENRETHFAEDRAAKAGGKRTVKGRKRKQFVQNRAFKDAGDKG